MIRQNMVGNRGPMKPGQVVQPGAMPPTPAVMPGTMPGGMATGMAAPPAAQMPWQVQRAADHTANVQRIAGNRATNQAAIQGRQAARRGPVDIGSGTGPGAPPGQLPEPGGPPAKKRPIPANQGPFKPAVNQGPFKPRGVQADALEKKVY